MRLILIRHGHATQHYVDETRKLSDNGQEQAKQAGQWLASHDICAEKIIHSPLKRAIETAQIVGNAIEEKGCTLEENKTIKPE